MTGVEIKVQVRRSFAYSFSANAADSHARMIQSFGLVPGHTGSSKAKTKTTTPDVIPCYAKIKALAHSPAALDLRATTGDLLLAFHGSSQRSLFSASPGTLVPSENHSYNLIFDVDSSFCTMNGTFLAKKRGSSPPK